MKKFIITEEEKKHIKSLYEQTTAVDKTPMKNPEKETFTPEIFNAAIGFLNSDQNPDKFDPMLKMKATGYLVDMRDDKTQNISTDLYGNEAIELAKRYLSHSDKSKKTNPNFNQQNFKFIDDGKKIKGVEIGKGGGKENIKLIR